MNPDLNSPKQSDICLYCLPYRPQKCIKSKNVVDSRKRFKLGWLVSIRLRLDIICL